MNIYLVTQDYQGYDTYDSVIVVASDEDEAKSICSSQIYDKKSIKVEKIDVDDYDTACVILESFNAG